MMPEMDGFSLSYKLKTDERTSHIPVVMLTAKSDQNNHERGLEAGADVYLSKPFSTKALALNVRNLLDSQERMRIKIQRQCTRVGTVTNTIERTAISNLDEAFLDKVAHLVDEHMEDPDFNIAVLSIKLAMSQPVLYKKIKALTNLSVNDFIKSLRLKKAARLLKEKQLNVSEISYAVGYNDRRYFSREFKKYYGKLPSEFLQD